MQLSLFSKEDKVLKLSPNDVIAKGLARTIYQHPDRSDVCIKIDHFEYRKNHKDSVREAAYYR